ncbi:hypothetical protein [Hirschia maritima]|uniref:hypothetical protein n=1 Tax=Hirschia maritima TaxID=1121961 RepID=UPI0003718907|nr:hypothetical protein [Hirschia maritima]
MIKNLLCATSVAASLCLVGCSDDYETPNKTKIKAAMAEWSRDAIIDDLRNLSCDNLGKGKFYCSFDISYIGAQTEHMEKCFFSGASELTIRNSSSCY